MVRIQSHELDKEPGIWIDSSCTDGHRQAIVARSAKSFRVTTMSDYYHHFLTSMAGVGGDPTLSQHDASIPVQQAPVLSLGTTPMSPAYQNLGGVFNGYAEPIMFSAPKAQRSRRKSAPGLDHIKHRRTRSGCYTCRSRRVKVVYPGNH